MEKKALFLPPQAIWVALIFQGIYLSCGFLTLIGMGNLIFEKQTLPSLPPQINLRNKII